LLKNLADGYQFEFTNFYGKNGVVFSKGNPLININKENREVTFGNKIHYYIEEGPFMDGEVGTSIDVLSLISYYEKSKIAIDPMLIVLLEKFPNLKGLGPAITITDLIKDGLLYHFDEISEKRFAYRAVAALASGVPLAGPSFTVGEMMYNQLCSTVSWINNTFTTQNFLDSNLFPH